MEMIIFKHYAYLACLVDRDIVVWEAVTGTIHRLALDQIRAAMPYNTQDYLTLFHFEE